MAFLVCASETQLSAGPKNVNVVILDLSLVTERPGLRWFSAVFVVGDNTLAEPRVVDRCVSSALLVLVLGVCGRGTVDWVGTEFRVVALLEPLEEEGRWAEFIRDLGGERGVWSCGGSWGAGGSS